MDLRCHKCTGPLTREGMALVCRACRPRVIPIGRWLCSCGEWHRKHPHERGINAR